MLNTFDMYDLHSILVNIRTLPLYYLNPHIIAKIIDVLNDKDNNHDVNQIRKALKSIKSINEPIYSFVYTLNSYPYIPMFIKESKTYDILIKCFKTLSTVVNGNNIEKVQDLADALHNLPLLIVENKGLIPDSFWNFDINNYKVKWDKQFLEK